MKPSLSIESEFKKFEATIEILEKYIKYHDGFLISEVDNTKKRLEKEKIGKEIEAQIELENLYHDYILSYLESTFPDIQNKMTVIISFSLFEGILKSTCLTLAKALNSPIDYYELSGDLFSQCKIFLTKFCGISTELFGSQLWQKIDSIRLIRNGIVHNNSEVSEKLKRRKQIISQFAKINGFYIIQDQVAFKTRDFSIYFISLVREFLIELQKEFQKSQAFTLN
jgi:hypothetical protein